MATTLNQLAVRYFSQRAAFEAQLQAPVLVWEAPARAGDPGAQDELDEGSWASTTAGGPMSRPRAGETLVFSVEKVNAKANAFAMGITVGRVDTNDVVVDDASVSRFHAYLQFDARKKTWSLTDADSKNGTFVGTDRLVQQRARDAARRGDGALWRHHHALLPPRGLPALAGREGQPPEGALSVRAGSGTPGPAR